MVFLFSFLLCQHRAYVAAKMFIVALRLIASARTFSFGDVNDELKRMFVHYNVYLYRYQIAAMVCNCIGIVVLAMSVCVPCVNQIAWVSARRDTTKYFALCVATNNVQIVAMTLDVMLSYFGFR